METLSPQQRELVALGAAMGSNCVPCAVNHVEEARKAGLTDDQIRAAIELAATVRRVPAAQVLSTALAQLGDDPKRSRAGGDDDRRSCCK